LEVNVDMPTGFRVLIIMADRWPRALMRAALIENGYDAAG
jgi:hypothetical protein